MSYPAIYSRAQIARRLKGQCRLRLREDRGLSFTGERLASATSCAGCEAPCEVAHARGVHHQGLTFEVRYTTEQSLRLEWACPACGRSVVEDTTLLQLNAQSKAIAADPLCHRCRLADGAN